MAVRGTGLTAYRGSKALKLLFKLSSCSVCMMHVSSSLHCMSGSDEAIDEDEMEHNKVVVICTCIHLVALPESAERQPTACHPNGWHDTSLAVKL